MERDTVSSSCFFSVEDVSPLFLCLFTRNGEVQSCSSSLLSLHGFKDQDLPSSTPAEMLFLSPAEFEQALSSIDKKKVTELLAKFGLPGEEKTIRWFMWPKERESIIALGFDQTDQSREAEDLKRQLSARMRDLQLVSETASEIAKGLNLQQTLEAIVSAIKRLVNCHGVIIFLMEKDGMTLRPWAVEYDPGVYPEDDLPSLATALSVKVGEGLSGWVAAKGEAAITGDAENDPRVRHIPGTAHIDESLMVVPLKMEGIVKGVIMLSRLGLNKFASADLDLISSIASQAIVAIENVRIYEEEKKKAERIALLRDLDHSLILSLDATGVAQIFAEKVKPLLHFERIFFFQLDRQNMTLRPLALQNEQLPNFSFSGSLAERIAEGKQVYLKEELNLLLDFPEEKWLGEMEIASYAALPLYYKDVFRGMVIFAFSEPSATEQVNLDLLQDISHPLAVALENARLYTEAKNQLEMLALLNRAGVAISTGEINLRQNLMKIIEEVRTMIGCHSARLYLLEENQMILRPEIVVYEPGHYSLTDEELISRLTLKWGEGITGWVAATGLPVITGDAERDPRVKHVDGTPYVDESIISVPLRAGERTRGALTLSKLGINQLGEQEFLLANTLAAQISMALENGRLYEEQLKARDQLENDIEKIKQLESVRENFLYSVSHELKTPLTSIATTLEMVEREENDKANLLYSYYDLLLRSSTRLKRLVDNLLETSKVSQGSLELHRSREDLRQLAEEVKNNLKPEAKQKNIDIEIITSGPLEPILVDRERILLILTNLVSNALKYSLLNGKVVILLNDQKDEVLLSVQDYGAGIPENELPHVFERFFRGQSGLSVSAKGTGVGLSLAKSLVEAHGGKILMESKVGQGTTVRFTLPKGIQA